MMLARTLFGLAILALAFDVCRSLAAGGLVTGSLFEVWSVHGPTSLDALRFVTVRLAGETGWTQAMAPLLALPGWLLLAGAAAIAASSSARARPRIPPPPEALPARDPGQAGATRTCPPDAGRLPQPQCAADRRMAVKRPRTAFFPLL